MIFLTFIFPVLLHIIIYKPSYSRFCLKFCCHDNQGRFSKNLLTPLDSLIPKICWNYSGRNEDPPLRFWVKTTKHTMERTNQSKLSFHYTA